MSDTFPTLYTVQEVAAATRINTQTIYRLIKAKRISHYAYRDETIRIPADEFDRITREGVTFEGRYGYDPGHP